MPYKIPGIPSSSATASEWADFVEFECLRNAPAPISFTCIQNALEAVPDESRYPDEPFEEEPQNLLEAFSEIDSRKRHCGHAHYPFFITDRGYAVQCNRPETPSQWVYPFLLLATRLNMTTNNPSSSLTHGTSPSARR